MFDYTSMMIQETLKDVKRIGNIAKYSTQGIYIAYLVYALIFGTGFWFINAPLLALAVAYLIYDLHSSNHKNKTQDKAVKKIYGRIKQAIKLFPLAVSLYSLYLTADTANVFTVITTAFMLISWLLSFIFDVIISIIEKRLELFKAAWKQDWENVLQPVKSVSNVIKKVTGKQVQPPTPTKTELALAAKFEKHNEQKEKEKAKKAEAKTQAKTEKQAARAEKIENLKRKFLSKQAERKLLQSTKRKVSASKTDEETPEPEDGEKE